MDEHVIKKDVVGVTLSLRVSRIWYLTLYRDTYLLFKWDIRQ